MGRRSCRAGRLGASTSWVAAVCRGHRAIASALLAQVQIGDESERTFRSAVATWFAGALRTRAAGARPAIMSATVRRRERDRCCSLQSHE